MMLPWAALAVAMLAACNVTKDLESAYNLKDCKYTYRSISNIKVDNKELSLMNTPKILALLAESPSSLPLALPLNFNVQNPNATAAALAFTEGRITEPFRVNAGETKTLSVAIGTDVGHLFSGESRNAMLRIVQNLIGIGSKEQSTVTVQLRPTFNIGGVPITSPVYIPVSFKVGGKN